MLLVLDILMLASFHVANSYLLCMVPCVFMRIPTHIFIIPLALEFGFRLSSQVWCTLNNLLDKVHQRVLIHICLAAWVVWGHACVMWKKLYKARAGVDACMCTMVPRRTGVKV